MTLSDHDIERELAEGKLRIDPIGDRDKQIQPASVDLRLSYEFIVFEVGDEPFIDPFNSNLSRITRRVQVEIGDKFILHPGEFVLASTVESVRIPDYLVARVDGRSSLGRLGVLMHATAGFIDPGFVGNITLELSNVNRMPVALYPGMRVCQISFEHLSTACDRPYGPARGSKYWGQTVPVNSRYYEDQRPA